MGPGAVGHIVVDAHGKGVGLLKHHADPLAEPGRVHAAVIDVLAPEIHLSGDLYGGYQVVHAVQRPQKGGLAAAGRANEGRDLMLRDIHIHIVEGMVLAVPQI